MIPMGSIPSAHGIAMGYPTKHDGIAMGSGWDLTISSMGSLDMVFIQRFLRKAKSVKDGARRPLFDFVVG